MALTPEDVVNKRFQPTKFREGYDQDEVDDFLDKVADQLAVTQQALAQAEEQVKQLQKQAAARSDAPTASVPLVTSASPAGSAEKILTLAQETADKHIADAKSQAAGIVGEAATQAEGIKGQAVLEAQQIRTQGLADKQKALDDLEARHGQVQNALSQLTSAGQTVRDALAKALAEFEGKLS